MFNQNSSMIQMSNQNGSKSAKKKVMMDMVEEGQPLSKPVNLMGMADNLQNLQFFLESPKKKSLTNNIGSPKIPSASSSIKDKKHYNSI